MGLFYWQNVKTLAAGLDLTAVTTECKVVTSVDELDITNMASGGTRQRIAGLRDTSIELSGWQDPTTVDATMFANVGSAVMNVMVLPDGSADAQPAFFQPGLYGMWSKGGKVGEAAAFSCGWKGSGALAQGKVLKGGNLAATGTGTIMQLGAVGSTQKAYFQIQVTSVTGTTPTLDVIVQSAALVGFGSPTTRATFTQLNAAGSQHIIVAGPITDAYWRVSYTLAGTLPVFATVVAAGICNYP